MATQEDLEKLVASRLINRVREETTASDVMSALTSAPATLRNELLNQIRQGNAQGMGLALQSILGPWYRQVAAAEAVTIAADSSLSIAELERIEVL